MRFKKINIFNCFYSQSSKGRRRHSRKNEIESDESDSDQDQLTSSRTESSNHLDAKLKHSKCFSTLLQISLFIFINFRFNLSRNSIKYIIRFITNVGTKITATSRQIQVPPATPPIHNKHNTKTQASTNIITNAISLIPT